MTTQEQQMLQDLTNRINNTQLPEKDPEAENYLHDTLGRNPDALYILAQTLLVTQYALEQAQKALTEARAQPAQPRHATSFLGSLLGRNDSPAPPPPPPAYSQPQYTPVPNYGPPQAYYPPQQQYGAPQPSYGYGYAAPQQGGFLRSAMQTATGVAAGALAFEGIESLMHGFGGRDSYGRGFEGGGGHPEEIVNNYYGDASSHERSSGNLGSDIEDRRNDFAGTGSNDTYSDDSSDGGNDFDSSDDSGSNNDDSSL